MIRRFIVFMLIFIMAFSPGLSVMADSLSEELELVTSVNEEELVKSDEIELVQEKEGQDASDKQEEDEKMKLECLSPVRIVVTDVPEGSQLVVEEADEECLTSYFDDLSIWHPILLLNIKVVDTEENAVDTKTTVRIYKDESELSGKYLYHLTDKAESMSFTSNSDYTQFSADTLSLFVFMEKEEKDGEQISEKTEIELSTDESLTEIESDGSIVSDDNVTEEIRENTEEIKSIEIDNSIQGIEDDLNDQKESVESTASIETKYVNELSCQLDGDPSILIVTYRDEGFSDTDELYIQALDKESFETTFENIGLAFELSSTVQDMVSIRFSSSINLEGKSLFYIDDEPTEIPYVETDSVMFSSYLNGTYVFADKMNNTVQNDTLEVDFENEREIDDATAKEYKEDASDVYEDITDDEQIDDLKETDEESFEQENTDNETEENEEKIKEDAEEIKHAEEINENEESGESLNESIDETVDDTANETVNDTDESITESEKKDEDTTETEDVKNEEKELEEQVDETDKEENEEESIEKESEDVMYRTLWYQGEDYKLRIDGMAKENSKLVVQEIPTETYIDEVMNLYQGAVNLPFVRFFEVSITDNEEVETGEMSGMFEFTDDFKENVETSVFQIDDEIRKINQDDLNFTTDHLSVFGVVEYYTVDFYYKDVEYHLSGGGRILLDELFNGLGIEQDADDVLSATFSNQECLTVGDESNGWTLESIKPFTSEERLAVVTNELEPILITCNYREIDVVESQADEKTYEDGELFVSGDNYEVSVTYTADARIPAGSSLDVREIVDDEYESYANDTMKLYDDATNLPYARFFDITILSPDGEVIEPTSGVNVSIRLMDEKPEGENVETTAVHFVDDIQERDEMSDELAVSGDGLSEIVEFIDDSNSSSIEQMDVTVDGDTVEFEAEAFSVYGVVCYYTVDFYYEDTEYHLSGGGNITLSELFEKLGIERSVSKVQNVEFTDYSLLSIAGKEDGYRITSLMPFQTSEELKVTMNDGEVIRIRTEDEPVSTAYAVLTNDLNNQTAGELIFFRSYESYTNNTENRIENPYTDIEGNEYFGRIFSEIETGNIFGTNNSKWYPCRDEIKSVQIAGNQTISPINCYDWFFGCSACASIDLTGLDTSNVTTMNHMFYGCTTLTDLFIPSDFDVSNVEDMCSMFQGCSALTDTGDLSAWNVSKVENMKAMFSGCGVLANISGLSDWDTSNVTSMEFMFNGCEKLVSIGNVTNWNTSNVTNMSCMFQNCKAIECLDLTNWNVENVTNMSNMFMNCFSLESVGDISNWKTANVTTLRSLFYYCHSLAGQLNVSKWNTSQVTDLQWTFYKCSSLTKIDMTGWDTSNVTNMKYMFQDCTSLTSVGDIHAWNTSNVTEMNSIFANVAIKHLDLSEWDTRNATMQFMFNGSTALSSIDLGENFRFNDANLPEPPATISSKKWVRIDREYGPYTNTQLQTDYTGEMAGTWVWDLNSDAYAVLTDEDDSLGAGHLIFFRSTESYEDRTTDTFRDISNNTYHGKIYTGIETIDLSSEENQKWHDEADTILTVNVAENQIIVPINCEYWFNGCNQCTSIDLTGFNTGNVTSFYRTFENCELVTEISGLDQFDVSNVRNMAGMFYNCSSLTELDIANWDTNKTVNMNEMFAECKELTGLGLTNWQMNLVTDTSAMFYNCLKLSSVGNLSLWNMENVVNMGNMFNACKSLTELGNVANWNTEKVTNMEGLFTDCEKITELNLSNWNTAAVTNMEEAFRNCLNLQSLNIRGWNTKNANMKNFFVNSMKLSSVTLGTNFSFAGSNASGKALLIAPTSLYYTSEWIRLENPIGSYSTGSLANSYNETFAGTWVWEPSYTVTITLSPDNGTEDVIIYEQYGRGIYKTLSDPVTDEITRHENPIAIPEKIGYTISFNPGDGTLSSSSVNSDMTFTGYYDGTIQLINEQGYITPLFSGKRYTDDTTLQAKWESSAVTLPTPTRENYECTGWYTEEGVKRGDAGGSYVPQANETLYARWSGVSYSVSFNSNGGSGTMSTQTDFIYGTAKPLSANTFTAPSDGWTFGGWATSQDLAKAGTIEYDDEDDMTYGSHVSGDVVTLYAVWIRPITFHCGINNAIIINQYWDGARNIGTSITVPTASECDDISTWRKLGWRRDTAAGTKNISFGETISQPLTTYNAVYSRELTLIYDKNSEFATGNIANQTNTQYYNASGNLSNPSFNTVRSGFTRTGYTFINWAKDSPAGERINPGKTIYFGAALDSDVVTKTLYAIWSVQKYSIEINNTITGSMGDKTKTFAFTMSLTDGVEPLPSSILYSINNGSTRKANISSGSFSFNLGHDDTILFTGFPYGTGYEIIETNHEYTVTPTASSGIVTDNVVLSFVNTLDAFIPSGIKNTNAYILLLILLSWLFVLAIILYRKRREDF